MTALKKLPDIGCNARTVIDLIHRHKTMTLDQLQKALPQLTREQITNITSGYHLGAGVKMAYEIPPGIKRLLSGESPKDDTAEAPPVVPPRQVDLLHRPAWENNLSAQARRPDAGPVHEISHYSSGTVATPFRGAKL